MISIPPSFDRVRFSLLPALSPLSKQPALPLSLHMGGCQNYGPFLGTLNIRCRIRIGIQKGTIILTTTHMSARSRLIVSQPQTFITTVGREGGGVHLTR